MEAMYISKLEAFYRHQSSSSLKVCVSNSKDNERPDILIYQADLWKKKEKIKHGNLDNCWLKGSQNKEVSETRSEMEIQWLLASNKGI